MTDFDAIVCGAGVAGLMTAASLARLGWRVVILDKQPMARPMIRGELLQPGSQDFLDTLGVLDILRKRGAVGIPGLAYRDRYGAEVINLKYADVPGKHREILCHEYLTIQNALNEALTKDVQLWRGTVVKGLLRDRRGRIAGVCADVEQRTPSEITATLVVAADGRTSRLRRSAGIPAQSAAYNHELVAFETPRPADLPMEVTAYTSSSGLRLLYPLPGQRLRIYIQIPSGMFRTMVRADISSWQAESLAKLPALRQLAATMAAESNKPQVLPVWRCNTQTTVQPGIVLVGEAARCMHPMAAQGMTAAATDASLLTAALAVADPRHPKSIDTALKGFAGRQLAMSNNLASLSHKLAHFFTSTTWGNRFVARHLVGKAQRNDPFRHRITRKISGLELTDPPPAVQNEPGEQGSDE